MNTLMLSNTASDISRAAEILQNGGLVAMPTETVYGLAANALNAEAVNRIFAAKGRPQDNPLIVHIADLAMLPDIVADFPESAQRLADAYWPGPLTIILPKNEQIPDAVTCGLSTVAVRFPSHPDATALIRACGLPLAAPSANLSGSPSPTTAAHVAEDLSGRIDAIIDGGDCAVGLESTVITLAQDPPRLLRPGGITLEQLRAVLGEVSVDDAVLHQLAAGQAAASPGMKYKHYAPKARVVMLEGDTTAYCNYLNANDDSSAIALCFDEDLPLLHTTTISYGSQSEPQTLAHSLFERLRDIDHRYPNSGIVVYAHAPQKDGIGLAVYNRLIRAAGFEVVQL